VQLGAGRHRPCHERIDVVRRQIEDRR
jgi:hypothetical protein